MGSPAVSVLAGTGLKLVCVIQFSLGRGGCNALLLHCHPGLLMLVKAKFLNLH